MTLPDIASVALVEARANEPVQRWWGARHVLCLLYPIHGQSSSVKPGRGSHSHPRTSLTEMGQGVAAVGTRKTSAWSSWELARIRTSPRRVAHEIPGARQQRTWIRCRPEQLTHHDDM